MPDLQTKNPSLNYLSRNNIKLPETRPIEWTIDQANATGEASEVLTTQDGAVSQDENQVIVLPEGVNGTYTITLTHSGGTGTTVALDLDAPVATIQAAVDTVTGAANEVVVTKATNRRVVGLTWSSATEDETAVATSTVSLSAPRAT
jgi:hypothetical protein